MTKRKNNRKTGEAARFASLYGVLIALAMVLSYVETLIPLPMLVPGAKLGLANLVTVVGLFLVGIPGTVCITVFRVVLAGLTFGNVYSMAYGLSGSFLSLFVMASVKKAACSARLASAFWAASPTTSASSRLRPFWCVQ